MEIFLALVAIILFAIVLKVMSDKFSALDYRLQDMTRALENLKRKLDERGEAIVPKAEESAREKTKPELTLPIPEIETDVADVAPRFPIAEKTAEIPVAAYAETQNNREPEILESIKEDGTFESEKPPVAAFEPVDDRSWWEKFKEQNPDLEKFIGENLINKIGVLILVLGISYFVKFAIDKDWINEPARVGIGMLAGALVMFFAHRLRKKYAAFSSVLVAGAIAIFYFTIGIAFHDYKLFSQTVAFAIMVVITAFSCVISLAYNRIELAVLSLIGGFAVPFMMSTGQGNYVVLFTYIAILDIGILALAYHKKWNLINILSFVFTALLFGGWLVSELDEKQPHYTGALAFAFVFYLIFVLIAIINNIRTKGAFSIAELGILSSNTFLFYAAGMTVLTPFHPELKGLFTAAVAVLNLIYAWVLYKKFGMDKTAVYLLIGLTLTFATLAIPIQFNGHFITIFWAAEAVILMWLGQKSGRVSYRLASVVVHVLAAISLFMDWYNVYNGKEVQILGNAAFVTGITLVASLLAIAFLLNKDTDEHEFYGIDFNPVEYRKFCGILAIILFYFVGIIECYYQADHGIEIHASALAVPLLFHMIYSAVVVFFLQRLGNRTGATISAVLSVLNVILFAFLVLTNAFAEHRHMVALGENTRLALYLHYICLAAAIYFAIQLYRLRNNKTFPIFDHSFFSWAFAFIIVYVASAELLLHTQMASNTVVSKTEIASRTSDFNTDEYWIAFQVATDKIQSITSQVVKTGFPILWGVLAFAFLIFGIKKPSKPMRIIALSLLGLTIVKLFVFDIRNASETGKIVAFILLGVLILIISFVYQKLKVLVLNDKSNQNPTEASHDDETV